jgi:hypothetical protein
MSTIRSFIALITWGVLAISPRVSALECAGCQGGIGGATAIGEEGYYVEIGVVVPGGVQNGRCGTGCAGTQCRFTFSVDWMIDPGSPPANGQWCVVTYTPVYSDDCEPTGQFGSSGSSTTHESFGCGTTGAVTGSLGGATAQQDVSCSACSG